MPEVIGESNDCPSNLRDESTQWKRRRTRRTLFVPHMKKKSPYKNKFVEKLCDLHIQI